MYLSTHTKEPIQATLQLAQWCKHSLTSSFFDGSLTFSILTLMISPSLLAPVTLWPSLNFIPCLPRTRWKVLDTSPSIPTPPIELRNSTAVTSAPRRPHTEPWKKNIFNHVLKIQHDCGVTSKKMQQNEQDVTKQAKETNNSPVQVL